VELPAQLSTTSDHHLASANLEGAACNACTDPKLLETPRSRGVGGGVAFTCGVLQRWGAPSVAPPPSKVFMQYFADTPCRPVSSQETIREEALVFDLVEPDRPQPGSHFVPWEPCR